MPVTAPSKAKKPSHVWQSEHRDQIYTRVNPQFHLVQKPFRYLYLRNRGIVVPATRAMVNPCRCFPFLQSCRDKGSLMGTVLTAVDSSLCGQKMQALSTRTSTRHRITHINGSRFWHWPCKMARSSEDNKDVILLEHDVISFLFFTGSFTALSLMPPHLSLWPEEL